MSTRTIRAYTVLPSLPERLHPLQRLASNLWWCWNAEAVALFRRIDPDRFESLDHSPTRLLSTTDQTRFEELAGDPGFLAHQDRVIAALDHYLTATTWFQTKHQQAAGAQIAYFSAEFGIHESVPVYSGGLGVLAGDHLKSASDLGLPLSGVSLMYREGYFHQYLNAEGWQQERHPENDFFTLPLVAEMQNGSPVLVTAPLPGRDVKLRIWHIQVGRVRLYLLDANIPENSREDRAITAQLYGGDTHTRLQQEIVLGIGGLRALRACGINPTVCHMNEGHAAFVGLERVRLLMEEHGLPFATAVEAVKAGTCFTTHTPVPAGNDTFPAAMIDQYFGEYMKSLGLERRAFFALGRVLPEQESEPFSMTVLALKLANVSNGVSRLHGVVSRKMWKNIWPKLPENEIPITSITNGVHTQSWIAPEIGSLCERYAGVQWDVKPAEFTVWRKIEQVPDEELWRLHERCRERLIGLARQRLREQYRRRGAPPAEVDRADEVLDPDALTIGFARRFATYKRGDLLFRDVARLAALVGNANRPVQFIFSGKAHPKDTAGKELIARVVAYAKKADFFKRIAFLEDYDMNVARHLVQGVDVWLNNPRRPLEASGTSGMKVACNGGLNLSILDGWWCEGFDGDNGWAIGSGEEYADLNYQDDVESRALYELFEADLVPMFYNRGPDGLPREWIRRMKRSIATLVPKFNTNRMVVEYSKVGYVPSHQRYARLTAGGLAAAGELAAWRARLEKAWPDVRVSGVELPPADALRVGAVIPVAARVHLGDISQQDVEVQACFGLLDNQGEILSPQLLTLSPDGQHDGAVLYRGEVPCKASGQYGYAVRVLPKHEHLANPFEPGLVAWG